MAIMRSHVSGGSGWSLAQVMGALVVWAGLICPGVGQDLLPDPTGGSWLSRLGLRHSQTDGRHIGLGRPLTGTSWLNRPYYVGAAIGPLWMTRAVEDSVGRDTDLLGTILIGSDWDHYWGNELRMGYATPELINSLQPSAPRGNRLWLWDYSLMYYPLGDAMLRPYWRIGVGNTKIDYPNDAGIRRDEWLLAFPIGVGVKYPVRRWLAARVELLDHLSIGGNGVRTQHNVTLLFGLEYRFGARPKSYWPWQPSRHIR